MNHIPPDVLKQHVAVLGKTGSGKTSTAKLAIEQVVAARERVCILDTVKSDWWGLTSSASGKSPGLPFYILGGPHGHVPLHASAGGAIAELVATGALPHSIIDMHDFGAGDIQRFFTPFAETLFKRMRGVLYLVIEEAHEVAPKERLLGDENMMIYWAKKLATAGRKKGVRLIVVSQSVQQLHNRVLGSCDTLIAQRLTAPADQKPVIDWLKANAPKDAAQAAAASLSSLKTGEGWIISGEAQIFERVTFPRIGTFDNSATPESGDAEHHVATAAVDVQKLREVIGDAVREAEENDVDRLKQRIRELETGKATPAGALPEELAAADTRGYSRGHDDAMAKVSDQWRGLKQAIQPNLALFEQMVENMRATIPAGEPEKRDTPAPSSFPAHIDRHGVGHYPTPAPRAQVAEMVNSSSCATAQSPSSSDSSAGGAKRRPMPAAHQERAPRAPVQTGAVKVSSPQQRILNVLAWFESVSAQADRVRVAVVAGVSPRSSGYVKNVGTLKTSGLVDYPEDGVLALSDAGRNHAEKPQGALTNVALHDAIRRFVSGPQWDILNALIKVYPESLSRGELAKQANVSAASSGYVKNVGTVKALGFATYPRDGHVAASPLLFVKGRK
jgi:hypothetical protein